MDFLETQDPLDAIRELFRETCTLQATGQNDAATARLRTELPKLREDLGEQRPSDTLLRALYRREKRRVEDALLTSRFIAQNGAFPPATVRYRPTETAPRKSSADTSPAESSRERRPSSPPDIANLLDAMLDQDRARTRSSKRG